MMRVGLSRIKRDNSPPETALIIYPDNEKEKKKLEDFAEGKIRHLKIEWRKKKTRQVEGVNE